MSSASNEDFLCKTIFYFEKKNHQWRLGETFWRTAPPATKDLFIVRAIKHQLYISSAIYYTTSIPLLPNQSSHTDIILLLWSKIPAECQKIAFRLVGGIGQSDYLVLGSVGRIGHAEIIVQLIRGHCIVQVLQK